MKKYFYIGLIVFGLVWVFFALQKWEDEKTPSQILPKTLADTDTGYYCQMILADHAGPKAQIHLENITEPLWFSQVSDAVAYIHDPERVAEIQAIYVSDMGAAENWASPGIDNWIRADAAHFVIESAQMGGMGTPDAIPYGKLEDAQAYTQTYGGRIVRFGEIPESYVRPKDDMAVSPAPHDAEGRH